VQVHPNHPNPFNPRTTLEFELDRRASTRIEIYDVAGRLIDRLDLGDLSVGRHEIEWSGRDSRGRTVAAGVYNYSVIADGTRRSSRMALVK